MSILHYMLKYKRPIIKSNELSPKYLVHNFMPHVLGNMYK